MVSSHVSFLHRIAPRTYKALTKEINWVVRLRRGSLHERTGTSLARSRARLRLRVALPI